MPDYLYPLDYNGLRRFFSSACFYESAALTIVLRARLAAVAADPRPGLLPFQFSGKPGAYPSSR
jgi:hypothetical protein